MKVLFATTNPAKMEYYGKGLQEKGFEVCTLKDLAIQLEVEEDGKNAEENAKIKARVYQKEAKIPTIAIDDNLFLEGVSEEEQPGTNVRRVGGKRLSDEEMIEYYQSLAKKQGGEIKAKWVKSIAICDGNKLEVFNYDRKSFLLVDKPCDVIPEGYPLDGLSIIPEFNQYLSKLSAEQKKKYKENNNSDEIFQFMIKTLQEMEK